MAAGVDAFAFIYARSAKNDVADLLSDKSLYEKDIQRMKKKYAQMSAWYNIFTSIITIYPLLGMLGTVIALIEVAGQRAEEIPTDQFFLALTSTAWGIIFSICFKLLYAFFQSKFERVLDDGNTILMEQAKEKMISEENDHAETRCHS